MQIQLAKVADVLLFFFCGRKEKYQTQLQKILQKFVHKIKINLVIGQRPDRICML